MFEYGMGAQVRTNKKKALQHFTVALLGVQALIVAKTDDVIGSIVSIALAIKDEDVINVFLPQVGDVGIFVSAAELWQQPSGLCVPACPLHPRCGHRCSMAHAAHPPLSPPSPRSSRSSCPLLQRRLQRPRPDREVFISVLGKLNNDIKAHNISLAIAIIANLAQWLLQPSLPLTPPASEAVAAVAAALHGSSSARPPLPHSPPSFSCVSPASCAALRAHVDRAHLLAAVHWATHLSLHGRSRRTTTPSNKFLLQFTTWQRHISAPMAVTWLLPPPKRLLQRKRL